MGRAFHRVWDLLRKQIEPDAGVMVDEIHGIHMGTKIQELAVFHGWREELMADIEDEFYQDATDEAIDYLNDNVAMPVHAFGHHPHSSDFMYMPEEWFDSEYDDVYDFVAMIDEARKNR